MGDQFIKRVTVTNNSAEMRVADTIPKIAQNLRKGMKYCAIFYFIKLAGLFID